MLRTCFLSIDVEPDFGKSGFSGVENLDKILQSFQRVDVKATLFTIGEILEKYPEKFRKLGEQYEIACHSFSHRFWIELSVEQRQKELSSFLAIYREIFGMNEKPLGFRAPSHLIDKEAMLLLEQNGFLYDSSIVPHYPFFQKYRGFKGKAPLTFFYPSSQNILQKGGMKILEIPVSGQIFGIPLAGAWLKKLPFIIYQILFIFYKPQFLTLSMHSWDVFDNRFLPKLEKILDILKKNDYQFQTGEQILDDISRNQNEGKI